MYKLEEGGKNQDATGFLGSLLDVIRVSVSLFDYTIIKRPLASNISGWGGSGGISTT